MAFAPVFQRPFSGVFDRRAAAAAAAPWWLAGGVAAANAVAVYQPKGAASLAASYSNLANPGTYDAAPGVAPTFDAATGWTFAGSKYLRTGYIPLAGGSMLVKYSGVPASGSHCVAGSNAASGNPRCYIFAYDNDKVYFGNGADLGVAPGLTGGVLGFAGQQGYRNGVADGGTIGAWSGTAVEIQIGCRLSGTVRSGFMTGSIQAIAIYNTTLAAAQVLSISAAMAAL